MDAVDPLRPRSSRSGLLGKKHMSVDGKAQRDSSESHGLATSRSSWFRKSIIRDNSPVVTQPQNSEETHSARQSMVHTKTTSVDTANEPASTSKFRPFASKRATWTNGANPANAAPMPILPSIRPISPLSDTVTALAHNNQTHNKAPGNPAPETKPSKKIGRQLSVQSNGNHYADLHRQESGRVSNGQRGVASPNSEQKESFFSHLRKRARRLSGKPQAPVTPGPDDIEAAAAITPRQSNRSSMIVDSNINNMDTIIEKSFENVDKALQSVNEPVAPLTPTPEVPSSHKQTQNSRFPERHQSLSKSASTPSLDSPASGAVSSANARTRRALHRSNHPEQKYDTPDEEDELLQEALTSANTASRRMDRKSHNDLARPARKENVLPPIQTQQVPVAEQVVYNPYPTPSSSAKRNGMLFDQAMMDEPVTLNLSKTRPKQDVKPRWPTPPYEENEWGASAAASIFAAAGSAYQ